jgi:hypothetical protein
MIRLTWKGGTKGVPKGSRERLWRPLDAFVPRAVANPIAALFKAYDFTLAMDFHTSVRQTRGRSARS